MIDWRDHEGEQYTSPVKDQGPCGSCAAFGIIAAVEPLYRIHDKEEVDLSEAQLFFCAGGRCETGAYPSRLLDYLRDKGVQIEAVFPYRPVNRPCHVAEAASFYKIGSWQSPIFYDWAQSIKNNGPLTATMRVYEDFFYYKSGVYEHLWGKYVGLHQVAIVGLSKDDKGYYWIGQNSWGRDWGESGFFQTREPLALYEVKLPEQAPVGLADLVINNAYLKLSRLSPRVEFVIGNVGDKNSSPCYLNVEIDRKVRSYRVWSIAPDSERIISCLIKIAPNSVLDITATIDPYDQVEETHEDNNIRRYRLVSKLILEEIKEVKDD